MSYIDVYRQIEIRATIVRRGPSGVYNFNVSQRSFEKQPGNPELTTNRTQKSTTIIKHKTISSKMITHQIPYFPFYSFFSRPIKLTQTFHFFDALPTISASIRTAGAYPERR